MPLSEAVQCAILDGADGQDPCICQVVVVGNTTILSDPAAINCPYSGHYDATEAGMLAWFAARKDHGLDPQEQMEMWLPESGGIQNSIQHFSEDRP